MQLSSTNHNQNQANTPLETPQKMAVKYVHPLCTNISYFLFARRSQTDERNGGIDGGIEVKP